MFAFDYPFFFRSKKYYIFNGTDEVLEDDFKLTQIVK